MTKKQSLETYAAEISLMDQMLAEPDALWDMHFETKDTATAARHRLHKARAADRDQSRLMFEPADIRHGFSSYDRIRFYAPHEGGTGTWIITAQVLKSASDLVGLVLLSKRTKEEKP